MTVTTKDWGEPWGDDPSWRPGETHREYLERMSRRNARIGKMSRRPSTVRSVRFATFDELWWRLSNGD